MRRTGHIIALAGVAFSLAASTAFAAEPGKAKPKKPETCFSMRDWNGWTAPDEKTLFIKVGMRDVWRIDLSYSCPTLTSPGVHLVTEVRGSDRICHPLDLDLSVADLENFRTTCLIKSIRQLSPEEAKAIPKKFQP
jgi:hypothetical protein